jgi:hypothetical protein
MAPRPKLVLPVSIVRAGQRDEGVKFFDRRYTRFVALEST